MKKQSTITESYEECNTLITQFKNNKLPLTAGCDMEGSLEAQVTGVLNNIRETVSKVTPHSAHQYLTVHSYFPCSDTSITCCFTTTRNCPNRLPRI